jgi:hypothetical protein
VKTSTTFTEKRREREPTIKDDFSFSYFSSTIINFAFEE